MSSTTVHSNKQKDKNTISVAGKACLVTENALEFPPPLVPSKEDPSKMVPTQVYEVISSYVEEKGNMEIPVGNSKVNENNTLEMEDGTVIAMVNPKAYQNLVSNKSKKAEAKSKNGETKTQVGIGRD